MKCFTVIETVWFRSRKWKEEKKNWWFEFHLCDPFEITTCQWKWATKLSTGFFVFVCLVVFHVKGFFYFFKRFTVMFIKLLIRRKRRRRRKYWNTLHQNDIGMLLNKSIEWFLSTAPSFHFTHTFTIYLLWSACCMKHEAWKRKCEFCV